MFTSNFLVSWQNDVFVVAEPGEPADRFLQSVKMSLSSMMRGWKRKEAYSLSKLSTIADLVAEWPSFQVGGILHRYIGRQTQVRWALLQFAPSYCFPFGMLLSDNVIPGNFGAGNGRQPRNWCVYVS